MWLQVYGTTILFDWSNTAANKRSPGSSFASFNFQTGRSYHILVSIDDDYVARFYVDGVLAGESAAASASLSPAFLDQAVVSIREGNTFGHLAVYDTAVSAARALQHHVAGRFAFGGDFIERTGTRVGRVLDEIGWPTAWRDLSDRPIRTRPLPSEQCPGLVVSTPDGTGRTRLNLCGP